MRSAVCTNSFASFLTVLQVFFKLASFGFQICDMVAVARLLNLTLVVPELDKTSFWADNRYFFCSWHAIIFSSFAVL